MGSNRATVRNYREGLVGVILRCVGIFVVVFVVSICYFDAVIL